MGILKQRALYSQKERNINRKIQNGDKGTLVYAGSIQEVKKSSVIAEHTMHLMLNNLENLIIFSRIRWTHLALVNVMSIFKYLRTSPKVI